MCIDFSVIIPTFRRPNELLASINSALMQKDVTKEVIVVDDSPEGSAREVISCLEDPRVMYLQNPKPSGGFPSMVRNLAWARAKGTFIHFLDDDDIVAEGYYAAAKECFSTRPKIGMVFGQIEPFGSCPPTQLAHERKYFADAARKSATCQLFGPKWGFTGAMLFYKALMVCSASIFRRECVFRLGGFDPNIRLMEDADFHVRVIRQFGTHFIQRTAIYYRIGSPSLMHSSSPPTHSQLADQRGGHKGIRAKYRTERGTLELYGLAVLTRGILGKPSVA